MPLAPPARTTGHRPPDIRRRRASCVALGLAGPRGFCPRVRQEGSRPGVPTDGLYIVRGVEFPPRMTQKQGNRLFSPRSSFSSEAALRPGSSGLRDPLWQDNTCSRRPVHPVTARPGVRRWTVIQNRHIKTILCCSSSTKLTNLLLLFGNLPPGCHNIHPFVHLTKGGDYAKGAASGSPAMLLAVCSATGKTRRRSRVRAPRTR